jgi:Tfp pilus assembly protein PilO
MIVGPSLYEWLSHNLFVLALAVGAVAAMGYYLYRMGKQKGRYRQ